MALRLLDARRDAARTPADGGVVPVWEASAFRVRTVRTNNPIHYEVAAHGDIIYTRAGDGILALNPDGSVRAVWPLPRGDESYAVRGMAAAPDGTLYVGLGTRVGRMSPDGTLSIIAGTGRQTPADGPLDEAQFTSITSLAYGPDGRLYAGDANGIRMVGPDGYTTTFAGPRPEQPAPDLGGASAVNGLGAGWPQYRYGGPPALTIINAAGGLSFGPDGSLYAGGYNELARVTPEEWVHWSRMPSGVIADGGPAEARFMGISGLAADPLGNLWVADNGNHRIRLVTPGGRVITVAEAAFEDITGVALDGRGRLWVTDNGYCAWSRGWPAVRATSAGETCCRSRPRARSCPWQGSSSSRPPWTGRMSPSPWRWTGRRWAAPTKGCSRSPGTPARSLTLTIDGRVVKRMEPAAGKRSWCRSPSSKKPWGPGPPGTPTPRR